MISQDQIAAGARRADEECKRLGLPAWSASYDIHLDGLVYVADQRALRGAMAIEGRDLDQLQPYQRQLVRLKPETDALMPVLTATWIDGFACALSLA